MPTHNNKSQRPLLVDLLKEAEPIIKNEHLVEYIKSAQEKSKTDKGKPLSVGEVDRIAQKLGTRGGNEFGRLMKYYPHVADDIFLNRTLRLIREVERWREYNSISRSLHVDRSKLDRKYQVWEVQETQRQKESLILEGNSQSENLPVPVLISEHDALSPFVPKSNLPSRLSYSNDECVVETSFVVSLLAWFPTTVENWRSRVLCIGSREDVTSSEMAPSTSQAGKMMDIDLPLHFKTKFERHDLYLDSHGNEWCKFKIDLCPVTVEFLWRYGKIKSDDRHLKPAWNALSDDKVKLLQGARYMFSSLIESRRSEIQQFVFMKAFNFVEQSAA